MLLRACDHGHASACGNAAWRLREGTPDGEPDLQHAFRRYTQGCDLGHGPACCEVAGAQRWGRGTPIHPEASAATYAAQCDAGEPCGCHGLPFRMAEGRGRPRDVEGAHAMWRKQCEAGFPVSCTELGTRLVESRHPPEVREEGLQLLRRACDLGAIDACDEAAFRDSDLDQAERVAVWQEGCDRGDGQACRRIANTLDDDPDTARTLRERACQLGVRWGCIDLATDAEPVEQERWYRRGVALGHLHARRKLGDLARESGDIDAALEHYRAACDHEHVPSCRQIVDVQQAKEAPNLTRDAALAPLFRHCDAGVDHACRDLARTLTPIRGQPWFGDPVTRDPRATLAAKRACDRDHGVGCYLLSARLHIGLGSDVDEAAAAAAAERACTLGVNGLGCERLAWHVASGIGMERDPERAEALLQRACDADLDIACMQLTMRRWLAWLPFGGAW